jgi:hypothetical protein
MEGRKARRSLQRRISEKYTSAALQEATLAVYRG